MTERKQRLRNSPKKYTDKGTGKRARSRVLCPICDEKGIKHYLRDMYSQFQIEGKNKKIKLLSVCLYCKHIVWYEERVKEVLD